MDRAKSLFIIVCILLLPFSGGPAQALGLGEARVNSFLNQPLDLTIRLLEVSERELETLTVQPAELADYERVGARSEALALGLRVELDRSARPPVIRVRSERNVDDPVVQILIDARWANGRVLREYTLFLDPPTVDAAPPAPPVTRAEPEARPPEPEALPAAPAPRPAPAREIADTYGPVAAGETLWSIAWDWRPDPSLNMNQVMLAILERNPEAFLDDNVNLLVRGARLEMPTVEEVRAIEATEATARIQVQTEAFRERAAPEEIPVVADAAAAAEDPVARAEVTDPAPMVEHRLELVPPREDDAAGGAGEEAELSRLQENLARMEEELFAAQMEAEDLRTRLAEIEAFLAAEGARLGLPDAEMARFQASLRELRLERLDDAETGVELEAVGEVQALMDRLGAESVEESALAAEFDDPLASAAEPQATAEPPPPVSETPPETRIGQPPATPRGWLTNPLVLGLIALVVLIAGLLIVRAVRNRMVSGESRQAPAGRAAASSAGDSLEGIREQVQQNPEDLAAHLALLKLLAARRDSTAFGKALEDMFGYVITGREPAWRDALDLASEQVPGHPLVSGSLDSMRPAGAAEEDSESKTIGDPAGAGEDEALRGIGHILREQREEAEAPDAPAMDPEMDLSDWAEPDRISEDRAESEERVEEFLKSQGVGDEPEPPDERIAPQPPESPQPAAEEDADDEPVSRRETVTGAGAAEESGDTDETDELSLDWTSESQTDDGELSAGGTEEDGIFSLGEDDAEVKLDLARAYISMDDLDAARTMLEEVVEEGTAEQRKQARELLLGL